MRWINSARAVLLIAALAGRVDAQPAPLSILDVPFISQSEALCGGAAAAMVLRYWGESGLNAESFAHLVDRSAAGIRTDALLNEIRSRGWTALALDGTDAALDGELRLGRPVITLVEDRPGRFHYVVVVAATPGALVFHDPARAPLRVVGRAEFTRRWEAARRWMAVIVPGDRERDTSPPLNISPPAVGSCEQLISDAVARAQSGDLATAEQGLTTALSCGGAAALRELAGVRVLQRRWADVEALSSAATSLDPTDPYGWRLLGTSRFVQNNPTGALEAWNNVKEPRLDLLSVAGLGRTRQQIVERLVAVDPGALVTPDLLLRSERRLRELPAALSTSIEIRPKAAGLAELRATVNERPVLPTDVWGYAAVAAMAASRRELRLSTGSLTGGGDRLVGEWRFWPGRQRIGTSIDAPAPWGGVWRVSGFSERERFSDDAADARRAGGFVEWSSWTNQLIHLAVEGGAEDWDVIGRLVRSRIDVRIVTRGSLLTVQSGAEVWAGAASFSRAHAGLVGRSSALRSGRVYIGRAGVAVGSSDLPPLLWFGGDTGQTRETLLRAHPLVDDGRLQVAQMGRRMVNASAEAQQWWSRGIVRVAAAVFLDAARVDRRRSAGTRGDVDAGAGLRIALPGTTGTVRADVATGLRHGATRWSFVYEP